MHLFTVTCIHMHFPRLSTFFIIFACFVIAKPLFVAGILYRSAVTTEIRKRWMEAGYAGCCFQTAALHVQFHHVIKELSQRSHQSSPHWFHSQVAFDANNPSCCLAQGITSFDCLHLFLDLLSEFSGLDLDASLKALSDEAPVSNSEAA